MKANVKRAATLGLVLPMLLLGGCAWQKDVDALRDQVGNLEKEIGSLKGTTKAAQSEASAAAKEAKAAAEKEDRILRESLRK